MTVAYQTIPAILRERSQWVVWKYETRNGKLTKVPYTPLLSVATKASSTDPATWGTYGAAITVAEVGKYDGVGYVLTKEDGIVFVDLDNCRNPETGAIEEWARQIVNDLNSYTEISPSGTGLHTFAVATLPPEGRRKGKIEMYIDGRFATITGNHLPGTPTTIEERGAEVLALHANTFAAVKSGHAKDVSGIPTSNDANCKCSNLSNEEIRRLASRASNAPKVHALWHGDNTGYTSPSEGDLALCSLLTFYTRDPAQLESLMRESSRSRDKWDKNKTYLQRTIRKALQNVTETYSPAPPVNLNGHKNSDVPNSQSI
jgi:putative DNA primase/helicase